MTPRRAPAVSVPRRAILSLLPAAAALFVTRAAPALAADPSIQIGDPPPGKALIVFYRKWEYPDFAISYIVREGQSKIGRLSAGTYFVAVVDPGLHTYTVHAERHKQMQIMADEGEIYYVRFELDIGVILYQPDLSPSEQWRFTEAAPHLRLSKPVDQADTAAEAQAAPPPR